MGIFFFLSSLISFCLRTSHFSFQLLVHVPTPGHCVHSYCTVFLGCSSICERLNQVSFWLGSDASVFCCYMNLVSMNHSAFSLTAGDLCQVFRSFPVCVTPHTCPWTYAVSLHRLLPPIPSSQHIYTHSFFSVLFIINSSLF